jgi:hypothetical protein
MDNKKERSIEELVDEELNKNDDGLSNLDKHFALRGRVIDDSYVYIHDLRESFGGFFEELFQQEPIAWIDDDSNVTKEFNEDLPEDANQLPLYDSLVWFELLEKWFYDAFEEPSSKTPKEELAEMDEPKPIPEPEKPDKHGNYKPESIEHVESME